MKLKKYNRKDCHMREAGSATVRVSRTGTFAFSKKAIEAMGITEGTRLNLLQDEDRPKDWYVEKTTDPEGLRVRKYKDGMMAAGAAIARQLLTSLDVPADKKSMGFMLASEPIEEGCFAIITSSAN